MVSDVVKTPSRRAFKVLILLVGLVLTCLLSPQAAGVSPGRALLFGLLVVVAAFTAAASPLFAILSVPGSWGAGRLPGTGELLSISDGLLLVGLLVPLLLVDFRHSLLRWALVTIAAFQLILVISLVHAPTIAGLGEWLHRLALVGGSVLIGAYLMQRRQFKNAFQILVLLSVIMAVASIIYSVTSGFQPSYALGFQKNVIGDMLAATALITYALPRDLLGFDRLRGPIIALLIAGVASSQSRGAAIALGVGTIVVLIARRSFGIRTAMVLLGALGLITFTAIQVQQDATTAAISNNPFGSVASRLTFQRQALEVWQASPIVGGGLRVFASQGSPLQSDPHNVIILTLAEGGLVGLAALGLLLVGVAVAVWRSGSSLAPLALGLLAFRFAHGLFDVYWVHGTQVLPWIVAGAALTMDRQRSRVTMGGRVPTSSVLPLGNAVRRPLNTERELDPSD